MIVEAALPPGGRPPEASSGGGALRAAAFRPDEQSQLLAHPLDLVAVLLNLGRARAAGLEQPADEDETFQLKE